MQDAQRRADNLHRKTMFFNQIRRGLEGLDKLANQEHEELSDAESQVLATLATWRDLHTAVVDFNLGDSAAHELGTERVVKDWVPLEAANAIGSYITGTAEPVEEVDPFDDRVRNAKLDKTTGKHRVLLDLDCPHVYVPSSTPGHGHMIIDVPNKFKDVVTLLNLMFEMGILQSGFASATAKRGETWLRAPGVKKTPETSAI